MNDERRASVEATRGFLSGVVLRTFLAVADDRDPRPVDAAAHEIIPYGYRTPLPKRRVVLGSPIVAGVPFDVKAARGL